MIGGVDPERMSIDGFFPTEEEGERKLSMGTKEKGLLLTFLLKHQEDL